MSDIPPTVFGPDMERKIVLEAYAIVGSTTVLIWDVIMHAPKDYEQIQKQGLLKPTRIIYCFSRLITVLYMLALCIVQTAPIGNCAWVRYIEYAYPFTIPITLLLFLFRVYALFRNRGGLCVWIFISWLVVLGSAIVVTIHTEGINVNGTKFCVKKIKERDVSDAVATLVRFLHDTLVFVVTSWWFFKSCEGGRSGLLFGKPLARSLLQDGQAYYLSTLILNVVAIVLPLTPKPFLTPCTLGAPLFVLISNMACHVYRNLVDHKYRDYREFSDLIFLVDGVRLDGATDSDVATMVNCDHPDV